MGQSFGVDVRLVSAGEARALMPFLDASGAEAITYYPGDIYLDPARLTQGYAEAAAKLGCALMPNTEVLEILVEAGVAVGVRTEQGELGGPVDAVMGLHRR